MENFSAVVQNIYREAEKPRRRQICASGKRRNGGPPAAIKEEILEAQGYCCYYCEHPLGGVLEKKGKVMRLRTHWDHVVPFAYLQANPDYNWVAACHVCNSIKSDKTFIDLDDLREYLSGKWESKGYEFIM